MYVRYAFIFITLITIHPACASEGETLRPTQPCTIPPRKRLEKTQSPVNSTSPMQLSISPFDENTTQLSAAYAFAQLAFEKDAFREESTY